MTLRRVAVAAALSALTGCAPSPGKPARPATGTASVQSVAPAATLQPTAPASGRWRSVQAGRAHACALSGAGEVWCWGSNDSLQVAPDCGEQCSTPRLLVLPAPAVELRLSDNATCARLASGLVKCWGQHKSDLSVGPRPLATRLAAGDAASCSIVDNQDLYCGGWNVFGRLGFPEVGNEQEQPVMQAAKRVPIQGQVSSAILLYQFGCAATATKQLHCWGTPLNCDGPRPIDLGEPVAAVEAGGQFACFLSTKGNVFGHAEYHQRVPEGSQATCQDLPQDFGYSLERPIASGAKAVACYGTSHCDTCQGCIVRQDDRAACWGLENGPHLEAPVALDVVTGLPKVRQVTVGSGFACALGEDQRVYCWGQNRFGQLGRGSATAELQKAPAEPRWPALAPR